MRDPSAGSKEDGKHYQGKKLTDRTQKEPKHFFHFLYLQILGVSSGIHPQSKRRNCSPKCPAFSKNFFKEYKLKVKPEDQWRTRVKVPLKVMVVPAPA
jgi:hypothetical protein